jgi:hypothetical protein
MNRRISLISLLMIPILLGSVAFTGAGGTPPNQKVVDQSITYELDQNTAPGSQVPSLGGEAIFTDMAMHGTLWTPEIRTNFALFRSYGWGTATKVKAASLQWVHFPLSYPTYINGVSQRIQYVEFCAQSSSGFRSGPTRMDLWAHNVRFLIETFAWPPNNNINCHGHLFATPIWRQDLGISVQLGFANTADTITLFKAWMRTVP